MTIESAYRDDLAYIHDAGYGHIARDAASRLIKDLAALECHTGTVVDFGCGSGILAGALVGAGYHVVGIDVSEPMVSLARSRVPGADFTVGSAVTAPVPASVAVTAVGEVLSYAMDSANDGRARTDWFRRVYQALQPGGLLLFDIAGPGRVPPHGSHRTSATGGDWAVLVETSFREGAGILIRKITSFRQAGSLYRRDDEVHRLSLIDPASTLATLRSVGFEARMVPAYDSLPLPRGVVAFLGRKPVAHAV